MWSVCLSKLSFDVIMVPRYLYSLVRSMSLPFKDRVEGVGLSRELEIISSLVFAVFSV